MAALQSGPAPSPAASTSATEGVRIFRDGASFLAGQSPAMSRLHGQIRYVAPYFRTALLTGERDCGEEAVARALHRLSPLAHRPFVELTPDQAELRFDETNPHLSSSTEGLIYLPHPERLHPISQKSLLRLLRERGAQAPRVVAFAENGVRSLVGMGTFSSDLADSLAALRIAVPPLRDRSEDIPALLSALLQEQSEHRGLQPPNLTSSLLDAANRELWPGNFAQLHSVAVALLARNQDVPLQASDLNAVLHALPSSPLPERRSTRMITLDQVIQEHIHAVLFACKGNKLRAAEVLGISRSTLYRMLGSNGLVTAGGDASHLSAQSGFRHLGIAS